MPSWKHLTKFFVPATFLVAALHGAAAGAADNDASLLELRGIAERMLETSQRLAQANAPFCREQAFLTGMALHSLDQYGPDDRAAAARAFGLAEGSLSVLAVANSGAAARAGVRDDDRLVAADGVALASPAPANDTESTLVQRTQGILDAGFADGVAELEIRRGGETIAVRVEAPRGCADRFELSLREGRQARANGDIVRISLGMARYAQGDELAAVVAHELAHNILRHRERLNEAGISWGLFKTVGRSARLVRITEIEADRLSIYLLDRAGYDVGAAARFWRRFGPSRDYGIFASPTHPGWRKRIASFEEEIATLARLKQESANPVPPLLAAPLARLQ